MAPTVPWAPPLIASTESFRYATLFSMTRPGRTTEVRSAPTREGAVSDGLVLRETSGGVATLTLNRPERRNGWSPELEAAYFAALDACDADDDVVAVVLTGAGSTFCPGLDTQRLSAVSSTGLDLSGRPPVFRARSFRKPLIAAINGACAGIGLIQALMCDVRFAARGARFSTAFARRGLAAEYAISWMLPRYVGVEHALDLLLSARTFEAEEAHRLGLVSRLCEPEDVLRAAQAYAADIAAHCAPAALAAIRQQGDTDLGGGPEGAMRRALPAGRARGWGDRGRGGGPGGGEAARLPPQAGDQCPPRPRRGRRGLRRAPSPGVRSARRVRRRKGQGNRRARGRAHGRRRP